jgi:toxin ParE1/3/4
MWRVALRPEVEVDVNDAADWYDHKEPGLGSAFVDEVIRVFDALAEKPLLHSRRHAMKDIRWRYPARFPYRVIYQVNEVEHSVVVAAVLHAARNDQLWRKRVE